MNNKLTWLPADTPEEINDALSILSEDYPVVDGFHKDAVLLKFESFAQKGTYEISYRNNYIAIKYSSLTAALRAIGTVLSGLTEEGSVIKETNPFETFGIMVDCSRNAVMKVEHFKKCLRRVALLGYNMAMLYTEDTYQLPDEEYFGFLRGAYTFEELTTIDKYAAALGVEMIPCIQTLGHLRQVLKWTAYNPVKDSDGVLLVDEPETYRLIEKMISFWSQAFQSRRIHLGLDETAGLGRGEYLKRHGLRSEADIMNDHIEKVLDICQKYGLAPMIWSDMFLRPGNTDTNDHLYENPVIVPEAAERIPVTVKLVHWDYYHDKKDFYNSFFDEHRRVGFEPVMASGIWTWSKVWYDRKTTEQNAAPCIESCIEKGIKEIFFTMWGDDGAYCDFDSAFAGIAWCAEKAFAASNINCSYLSARFAAVCKADYDTNCSAAKINQIKPAPCGIWDDPLFNLYFTGQLQDDQECLKHAKREYLELAKELKLFTDTESGNFEHLSLIAEIMNLKTEIVDLLINGWNNKDRVILSRVIELIPEIVSLFETLAVSFRETWMERNKALGFEVIQLRCGASVTRYKELKTRLEEFLRGEIYNIPEFEALCNPRKTKVRLGNHMMPSSINVF